MRRERSQKEPQSTNCLKYIGKMNVSETFTGPMMGHQWTIKKTRPGPQWPQMGAKENAQTVYFKRFCVFFRVQKKYAFGAPKASNLIGVRGWLAPNGVFFSCMRCGGGSGAEPASVRPCVCPCVRASAPPAPFFGPEKTPKTV